MARLCGAGDDAAARQSAQAARDRAKQAGFKLELREFAFQLTPEEQNRAAAITNAGFALRSVRSITVLEWMEPVVRGAARCGWQGEEKWDEVAAELQAVAAPLDTAARFLRVNRPLHFVPQGPSLLLPHLAGLKSLANAFTARMALALRAGDPANAWDNLLSVTALATRYEPEPCEISHLLRAGLLSQAFAATWEALRTNVWTDAQLAELTAEWSRAEVFRGVPDTAMLQAALFLGYTAGIRAEYLTNSVVTPELPRLMRLGLTEPGGAWDNLRELLRHAASMKEYARRGSYHDEALIIRFYQKQAGEYRQAIAQTNWLAMRRLPGVTNQTFLQLTTNTPSPLQSMANSRALMLGFSIRANGGGATTLLGRLAEAESRRRVLLTALAVERERRRLGRPPGSLAEVPGSMRDFITGEALRYRVEPGGKVVIYSPGLDAEDNRGEMAKMRSGDFGAKKTDLVWPRTATAREVADQRRHLRSRSFPPIDPRTGNFLPMTQPVPEPADGTADDPP